jgi:ferredoxin
MPISTKSSIQLTPQICVKGEVIPFTDNKQTLLECLEQANIEVHYHCRDGFCGACRVTLVAGEINYPNGEPLAFVGDNEILPCCCVPVTNISLELDE